MTNTREREADLGPATEPMGIAMRSEVDDSIPDPRFNADPDFEPTIVLGRE